MCNNNIYSPLHCHSWYSLLDGLPSPKKIIQRAKEIGAPAISITDHGNMACCVEFEKIAKEYGIKNILGCEIYQSKLDARIKDKTNGKHHHLTLLAKNQDGIKELFSIISQSNHPDFFYKKPRLDLDNISNLVKNKNIICLSGCIIGELSSSLFDDVNNACSVGEQTESMEEVRKLLKHNWRDIAEEITNKYIKVFGKENFFIELQEENMPAQKVVVECLREISKNIGIKSVATLDAHYCKQVDVEDHRILLYSQMHTTAEEQQKLKQEGSDVMAFFHRDTFYIFDYEEMSKHYSKEEIEQTLVIADMVSPTKLGRLPCLPKYITPNNISSDDHVKQLCIESAKIKFKNFTKEKKQIYWDRLKHELSVIKETKLSDYFLIVWDFCKFIDKNNAPRGKGRGSGAGSLINYLLEITKIDPLEYGLYFERFFNRGREKSLPDIDTDISVDFREKVVEYLINKYGEDKVMQMITFGRLQGKASLKEVFRAQPDLVKHLMKVKYEKEGKNPKDINISPFDLCNEITSFIPDEAAIMDDLQHMREENEGQEYGILQWSIDNIEQIKNYYQFYKPLFDQAMRLEGTKKSQSKHAAGLVIANEPIENLVPLTYEPKNKTRVAGLEMSSAEAMGCVKFDLLGVVALDKIWLAQDLINGKK